MQMRPSGVRTEIDEYLRFAFPDKHATLSTQGKLNLMIDEAELYYKASLESLFTINHNEVGYIDLEDRNMHYSNIALTEAFQELSRKLIDKSDVFQSH